MKKITLCAILLALLALIVSCRPALSPNDGLSTNESQIPVTSPNGFEDVTAPPEKPAPADTTNKTETTKAPDTTKTEETEKETESDEDETTNSDTQADTTVTETTAPDTTAVQTTAPTPKISTPEEAIDAAKDWLGDTDPQTGYKYAYSYDGMIAENGKDLFKIRVSWFIEEQERYSLCGYLLVSPDGTVSKYSW